MTIYAWILFNILFMLLIIQITLTEISVYNDSDHQPLQTFDDQEGNLDPSIPSKGIIGYITTTNPSRACSKIAPPPDIPTFGYQWIALIPRTRSGDDSCDFAVKVAYAHDANFSAVIIYNYDESLITMQSDGQNAGIPSTFVTLSSGLKLIEKYLYNVTYNNGTPIFHIKMSPQPPFEYGPYLITFMCVIFFSCLSLFGCLLVKCCIQRRRAQYHRLPRSALKKLKIKKFVKGDPWDVCAICLDDYEVGAKLRILPCEHAYHMKCIDPWLIENRRQCPVCKRYVFPDDPDNNERNAHQPIAAATEQTPLISSNNNADDNSRDDAVTNRSNLTYQTNNLTEDILPSNSSYRQDNSSDDEKDLSLSLGPATTSELVFQRSSTNLRGYGATNNSSITSHNVNLFNGSLGGITDNTNVSRRSLTEDNSDFETMNINDERMHSMRHVSEENPAYVDDEQPTKTI